MYDAVATVHAQYSNLKFFSLVEYKNFLDCYNSFFFSFMDQNVWTTQQQRVKEELRQQGPLKFNP